MENIKAIEMLQDKAKEVGRLPKKSDFTSSEICFIKAKLGAWNRALESAGLKEISAHYLAKRERVKNKRLIKKCKKQENKMLNEMENKMQGKGENYE